MLSIPDHPVIQNCERTGWPDGKKPAHPVCPVCGEECDRYFLDWVDNIIGCDECLREVREVDAWEEMDK